jgi:AdoMet-dependent heme synthase
LLNIRSKIKKLPGATYIYSTTKDFAKSLIRRMSLDPEEKVDLLLNFTTVCNYQCVFCNRLGVQPEIIKLSDIEKFDELLAHAAMVDITGYGEITTHPEFEKIIELLSSKGTKIRMVTNGSRLTEGILEKIVNANFREIVVSLNSLHPETYNQLCGKHTSLEVVLNNLENLMKRRPQFPIHLSFVITALNFHEIGDFVRFTEKEGFASVSCLGLTPTLKDMYCDELIVHNTEENRTYLNKMRLLAKTLGVKAQLLYLENQQVGEEKMNPVRLRKMIQGCDWVFSKMGIEPDGKVVPCCWSNVVLGNIKEQSFRDIWLGEKYQKLRRLVRNGDTTYCRNCRRLL